MATHPSSKRADVFAGNIVRPLRHRMPIQLPAWRERSRSDQGAYELWRTRSGPVEYWYDGVPRPGCDCCPIRSLGACREFHPFAVPMTPHMGASNDETSLRLRDLSLRPRADL